MISAFRWTENATKAALLLADGKTQTQVAETIHVTDRTIRNWLEKPEFGEEVDRLSLMIGLASRAARMRLAKRIVGQRVKEDEDVHSDKDILDWLKYLQSETDGVKLDLPQLAAFLAASAPLAGGGPGGLPPETDGGAAAGGGAAGGADGEA